MMQGKPITQLMAEIENGQFVEDATAELRKVIEAVIETRKPGKIKLVLDIRPTGMATVNIDADISGTAPEHSRPTTTFFIAKDGVTLQRRDPNQADLPLRVVPDDGEKEPLRVAE